MSNASLELGGDNWAAKDGNLLGYAVGDSSGKYVPREFTFTRGSNLAATRVAANGLIEKGRENLLLQSNNFGTTWTRSNVGVTSGQSGYDDSSDAWLLDISGGASSQRIEQSMSFGGIQTFSVYAKAGTLNWIRMRGSSNTYFDLANGVIGADGHIDSKIESIGNGWYRCSVVTETSTLARIYLATDNGNVTQSSGNIYIQDAQLEQGLVATDYIETGATTVQAGLLEDEPRIDYTGGTGSLLLEPSRTNVWEYSEYLDYSFDSVSSVTTTQNTTETLSPEGLYNATKLEGVGSWSLRDFIGGTGTGTWTISCYVKAVNASSNNTFRLSVGGNNYSSNLTATSEWQRFEFTFTNGSQSACGILRDSSANDADLYIYGVQVEEGSYPTSYIPNHSGGSVTRAADDCDGAVNASNFNDTEGVLYIELSYLQDGRLAIKNSDSSDQVVIGVSSGNIFYRARENNTNIITEFTGVSGISNRKIALRYRSGDTSIFIDGVEYNVNTSNYTLSSLNQFLFFSEGNTTYGNVKQVLYFPTALSDAQCSALTVEGLKEEILTSYIAAVDTLEDGAEARLDTYLQNLEELIV